MNVEVEFDIELDKSIYQTSAGGSKEEFFNTHVIKHIASDANFINRLATKQLSSKEQQEWAPYIQTISNMLVRIQKSISYQTVNTKNGVEEIKVKCSFEYFDNSKFSVQEIIETEFFTRQINSTQVIAQDLNRLYGQAPKEKLDAMIKMYEYIGTMLDKARSTLKINGVSIEKSVESDSVVLEDLATMKKAVKPAKASKSA